MVLFSLLALIPGLGHISFTDSDSRDKACFFGTGFRVRAYFFGSEFRNKVFLSLAQVLDPGCVSFTGSEFRARVGFLGCPFYSTLAPTTMKVSQQGVSFLVRISVISSCLMTKVCSVFSNRPYQNLDFN